MSDAAKIADLVAALIVKSEAAYEQSLAEYQAYHATRFAPDKPRRTREKPRR